MTNDYYWSRGAGWNVVVASEDSARPSPKMINASQDDHPRPSANRKKPQEMAEGAQDAQGDQGSPIGRRRLQIGSAFVQEQNECFSACAGESANSVDTWPCGPVTHLHDHKYPRLKWLQRQSNVANRGHVTGRVAM